MAKKAIAPVVIGEGASAITLVLMLRDPQIYTKPWTVEVHPAEVDNYRVGGWVTEAEAGFEIPDETAEVVSELPPYDEALSLAKRLCTLQFKLTDDERAKFEAEMTAFAQAERDAAAKREALKAQEEQQNNGGNSGGGWGANT
jgi:hypothetical protein